MEKKQWYFFRQRLTQFRVVCILAAVAVLCGLAVLGQGVGKKAERLEEEIPEEKKLVLFTSHKPEVYDPIVREFESRTGIWVDVRAGGTTELWRRLKKAEKREIFPVI